MAIRQLNDGTFVDDNGNIVDSQGNLLQANQLGFTPQAREAMREKAGDGGGTVTSFTEEPGNQDLGLADLAPVNTTNTNANDFFSTMDAAGNNLNITGNVTDPNTETVSGGVTGSFSETDNFSQGTVNENEQSQAATQSQSNTNQTGQSSTQAGEQSQTQSSRDSQFGTDTTNETISEEATRVNSENQTDSITNQESLEQQFFDQDSRTNSENQTDFIGETTGTEQGWFNENTQQTNQSWNNNQQQTDATTNARESGTNINNENQVSQTNTNTQNNTDFDSVTQANREGETTSVGDIREQIDTTNRTEVEDSLGFQDFLRQQLEASQDEVQRRNDLLAQMASGVDSRALKMAASNAISGPQAAMAGGNAQSRVASDAIAAAYSADKANRVNAASNIRSGANDASSLTNAARQFAGVSETGQRAGSTESTETARTNEQDISSTTGSEASTQQTDSTTSTDTSSIGQDWRDLVQDTSESTAGTSSGTNISDTNTAGSNTNQSQIQENSNTTELGSQNTNTSGANTNIGNVTENSNITELGSQNVNTQGTQTTNQSVTGFENVDETINSVLEQFSDTFTAEEIDSVMSEIQNITRDAQTESEAMEKLSGTSFGTMFGEVLGRVPETSSGGKVVCGVLTELGLMPHGLLEDEIAYFKENLDQFPFSSKGYLLTGQFLAVQALNRSWVAKALAPIAISCAKTVANEINPYWKPSWKEKFIYKVTRAFYGLQGFLFFWTNPSITNPKLLAICFKHGDLMPISSGAVKLFNK